MGARSIISDLLDYSSIAIIGERELVLGFKLIGINDIYIQEGAQAVNQINLLLEEKQYGIVLVSESIRKYIDNQTARRIDYSLRPLIIFIPMEGAEPDKESVELLAKRVLGVDIKSFKGVNK